jgi:hypothetical protein
MAAATARVGVGVVETPGEDAGEGEGEGSTAGEDAGEGEAADETPGEDGEDGGEGESEAAAPASGTVKLVVYHVPECASTTTAWKVTGPEPAAGAVHVPEATVLAAALACVRPAQAPCVRAPAPAPTAANAPPAPGAPAAAETGSSAR